MCFTHPVEVIEGALEALVHPGQGLVWEESAGEGASEPSRALFCDVPLLALEELSGQLRAADVWSASLQERTVSLGNFPDKEERSWLYYIIKDHFPALRVVQSRDPLGDHLCTATPDGTWW